MESPDTVLADLRDAWRSALTGVLAGLYVHGSLVAGDFAPERSDLDVLAVLTADPDHRLLPVLAGLHAGLDDRHPGWAGRIEVEYISIDATGAAAAEFAPGQRLLARISPGEPLHLLPVTRHRIVTWSTVRDSGRCLLGPPAAELLPPFDAELVRSALVDHVRDWPTWVEQMTTPGAQSYSVLTMCRAVQHLRYGSQLSKRRAADRTVRGRPEWSGLIGWARDWWYGGGDDTDPGRGDEVRSFVAATSADLLRSEAGRTARVDRGR
ncbi:aminoglycoside adenylyltransferase domain-containing protein [Actinoplanes sp. M2I2]|uniref:aminoglycoside adenylyltransferase domain-containing protein n=1 Tax=Actinoplanes sp. M2I2 TaxID=1734444 RepID=UPI002021ADB7|nr:aminoglycoside adenylyltransferase domain-containing protein [Actinoplanes sp. M2I2]